MQKCTGCKHLYKKFNTCLNKQCFKNGNAQILKHTDTEYFQLDICIKNNYFEKGKSIENATERNSKFNAKKVVIDGITFDSTSEGNRYSQLKLLERAGKIKNLQLQPKFPLKLDKKERYYIADFEYYEVETNKEVVEDVKGVKTPVYKLKKARFLELYPQYDFREVYDISIR